jgi:hypothetical protein
MDRFPIRNRSQSSPCALNLFLTGTWQITSSLPCVDSFYGHPAKPPLRARLFAKGLPEQQDFSCSMQQYPVHPVDPVGDAFVIFVFSSFLAFVIVISFLAQSHHI